MRRSVKSNSFLKHIRWGSVFVLALGIMALTPSLAMAKQATLELEIVPPGCQVSQVTVNGETQTIFTPTGCEKIIQPSAPVPAPQQPALPPSGQGQAVTHLLLPAPSLETPSPAKPSQPVPHDSPRKTSVAAPVSPVTAVSVAVGATAAVAVGVGIAIGVHSAVAAAAAGSSSAGVVAGVTRSIRNGRKKTKKPH